MAFMQLIQSWQVLVVALAGWINRHQQDVIAYIQEENRILRSKLKGKRIRFTDDERRRLAVNCLNRNKNHPFRLHLKTVQSLPRAA